MEKSILIEQKVPLALYEVTTSDAGHFLMVAPMMVVSQVYELHEAAEIRISQEVKQLGYCELFFNKRGRFAHLGSIIVRAAKEVR